MKKNLFISSKQERKEAKKGAIAGFALALCGTAVLNAHASILNTEVEDANKKLAKVSTALNIDEVTEQDTELSQYIDDYNKAASVVNARSTQMPLFWIVSKAMDLPKYELL